MRGQAAQTAALATGDLTASLILTSRDAQGARLGQMGAAFFSRAAHDGGARGNGMQHKTADAYNRARAHVRAVIERAPWPDTNLGPDGGMARD